MAPSIHTINITLAPAPGEMGFLVISRSSEMGGHVSSFAPPFEAHDVWSLLDTELDRNPQKAAEKLLEAARERGKALFSSLFDDRLRGWLTSSGIDIPIRLWLRYHLNQAGGTLLHNLPWEWMHDGRQFLVLSKENPITLIRELAECPPRPLMTDRICKVMLAYNQAGAEFMPIEWGGLPHTMNQSGLIPIPTALVRLEGLPDCPHRGQPQIFHYAGHGRFDADRGIGGLVLAGGDEDFVPAVQLAERLVATGDYRICLFNCCQGVRIAHDQPYGGLATATLKAGLPACLAMYHELQTRDALKFADAFYRYLGAGRPLDLAVRAGRLAVRNTVAALLPCLFLQSGDDRLYGRQAPISQPPPLPPATELPTEPATPWQQFGDWLQEAEAPLFGTHGLLEPFQLSILAREWFRLEIYPELSAKQIPGHEPRYQVAWAYVTDDASRGSYQGLIYFDDARHLEERISKLIDDLDPGPVPVTLAVASLDEDVPGTLAALIDEEVFPNLHLIAISLPETEPERHQDAAVMLEPTGPRPHWIHEPYRKSLTAICHRLDPVFDKAHEYQLPIEAAIRTELIQRGEIRPIHFEDLDEDPELVNRTLIITGLGGIGKTTLIKRWLTRRLAHDEPIRPSPLYLPLRYYRPGRLQSLLIQQGVLQTDASAFEKHNWVAALDGYDELVDTAAFWEEWWSLVPNPARVRILITSRETADLERQLPGAPTIRVGKLSASQIKEMVETYEPARAEEVLAFLHDQRLEAECQVPLWLIFVMLIHRIPDLKRLEELQHPGAITRGLLFQIMIEHFFLKWEGKKRTMKVASEVQLDALGRIAFGMHRDGKVSAGRTEIFDIVHASEAHRSLDFDTLLREFQKSQLLMAEAGMFSFPHKSFLEFFAGRYLKDRELASGIDLYRHDKWREPLKYALGLMETDRAAALLELTFRERKFGREDDPLDGFHFLELIHQVKNFRTDSTTTDGPAARLRQELRGWLDKLVERLPSLPATDATGGRHRDIELGLGTACLFPPDQSVPFLTAFLERTQYLTIQVIDHLGSIADMRAAELLLDKVMANPDERLLRRAVDTGLKKHMEAGEPLRGRLKKAIWQRIIEPGSFSREQHLKRRWHLIHLLEEEMQTSEIKSAGPRLDTLPPEDRAACLIYLMQNKATAEAVRLLCETFAKRLATDESAQRHALEHLLDDGDWYLRRLGAHFLRVTTFDTADLAFQALQDERIEVRFSSLKSLAAAASRFPQYLPAAKRALLDAIRNRADAGEEHFRQVVLGVLKQFDYDGFVPLAIEALETETNAFKIDMIHDLKFATGFWRRVARNRLDYWRRKGSQNVREAAAYVYQLLQ